MQDFQILRWTKNILSSLIDDFICEIQRKEFSLESPEKYNFCIHNMTKYYCGNHNEIDFFVAFNNKNVVGSIGLRKLDDFSCELRKFYVHQNFRSHGLGKKLFEIALLSVQENRYERIYAGMMKEKIKAQLFYEKYGFHKITKEKLPLTFQAQSLDEIFYELEIEFQGLAAYCNLPPV